MTLFRFFFRVVIDLLVHQTDKVHILSYELLKWNELALSTKEKARDRCMIRSCSNSMVPNYIVKCSYFLLRKIELSRRFECDYCTCMNWTVFSGCLTQNLGTLVIAHVHIERSTQRLMLIDRTSDTSLLSLQN